MFTLKVIDTDKFNDMPISARLLYYELGMRADDDGFVASPKKIVKMVGCSEDDLKTLIIKKFVICFESGIIVITHWNLHNRIRKDRKKDTLYQDEKALLMINNNEVYTLCQPNDNQMTTNRQPTGCEMSAQDKISKDNINILSSSNSTSPLFQHEITEIINHLNSKTGKKFRTNSKQTVKFITARLNEEYTVDDFKRVIDNQVAQWGNNKDMQQYLRPETLFRSSHFESYLNSEATQQTNTWNGLTML